MRSLFGVMLCAAFVLLAGCGPTKTEAKPDLTSAERNLSAETGVDLSVAAQLKTDEALGRFVPLVGLNHLSQGILAGVPRLNEA